MCMIPKNLLLRCVDLLEFGNAILKVRHAASSLGPLEMGLLRPAIGAHAGVRVAT